LLHGFGRRECQRQNLATLAALRQVFEYARPLHLEERTFGEGCEHIGVRVLRRGCHGLQALAYDLGYFFHLNF
jgi:hypothetical protein